MALIRVTSNFSVSLSYSTANHNRPIWSWGISYVSSSSTILYKVGSMDPKAYAPVGKNNIGYNIKVTSSFYIFLCNINLKFVIVFWRIMRRGIKWNWKPDDLCYMWQQFGVMKRYFINISRRWLTYFTVCARPVGNLRR